MKKAPSAAVGGAFCFGMAIVEDSGDRETIDSKNSDFHTR